MIRPMAKASKGGPARKAPEPQAHHLTASMRVLRSHLHRPALVVEDAHHAVKELALRLGTGESTTDDLVLEEKLKKATGVEVAELAGYAEGWPD
jgi:hypothetical protein